MHADLGVVDGVQREILHVHSSVGMLFQVQLLFDVLAKEVSARAVSVHFLRKSWERGYGVYIQKSLGDKTNLTRRFL